MCYTTTIPINLDEYLHVRGYKSLFIDDIFTDEDLFVDKSTIITIVESLGDYTIICSLYKIITIIRVVKKEITPDLYLEHYGHVSDWKANIELVNRAAELEILLGRLMAQLTQQ